MARDTYVEEELFFFFYEPPLSQMSHFRKSSRFPRPWRPTHAFLLVPILSPLAHSEQLSEVTSLSESLYCEVVDSKGPPVHPLY
jgi:hypothetical protein